jgi:hypothetical protein
MLLVDRCQVCPARRHANLSYMLGMQGTILHKVQHQSLPERGHTDAITPAQGKTTSLIYMSRLCLPLSRRNHLHPPLVRYCAPTSPLSVTQTLLKRVTTYEQCQLSAALWNARVVAHRAPLGSLNDPQEFIAG